MGYQSVTVEYGSGKKALGTVYNCEFLVTGTVSPSVVRESSLQRLFGSATTNDAFAIRSIQVAPRSRTLTASRTLSESASKRSQPASEAPLGSTGKGSSFARFTAYENDRRITADGALVPGTYATTWFDALLYVRTGEEAVERYALPDPTPAKYRFKIDPPACTPYREGVVQPSYEHEGGGAEVLFEQGTAPRTVTDRKELPER